MGARLDRAVSRGLCEGCLRLMQRHRRGSQAGRFLFREAPGDPFLQPGGFQFPLALLFRLTLGEAALLTGEGRCCRGGAEEGEQVRGIAAGGQVLGLVGLGGLGLASKLFQFRLILVRCAVQRVGVAAQAEDLVGGEVGFGGAAEGVQRAEAEGDGEGGEAELPIVRTS